MQNIGATYRLDLKLLSSSIIRPSNTDAYTAGDSIAAVTTDNHFSWQIRTSNELGTGIGEILQAKITSSGAVATSLDARLSLFHTDVSEDADNAALSLSDAEHLTRIGVINFATASWEIFQNNSGLTVTAALKFAGLTDGRTIYGVLEARNSYVPISAEVFTIDLLVARY